jgi:hypothetical protein
MHQHRGWEVMCIFVQPLGFDVGFGIDHGAAKRGRRRVPTGCRGVLRCIVSRRSVWCSDMLLYFVAVCRNVTLKLGFSNPNFIFCAF